MKKAPRFRLNNPALQNAFDKMADFLDEMPKHKKIIAGENIRKEESVDEVVIHGTPAGGLGGGGGGASCECPFDVTFRSIEGSDPVRYECIMNYGRVNNSVVDITEVATNIDPEAQHQPKYVCLEVTFGSTGGIQQHRIQEKADLPDDPEPEESYPTTAEVVMGVRVGLAYHRIIGCHNLLIYPIRIGAHDSNYWSYEVMAS